MNSRTMFLAAATVTQDRGTRGLRRALTVAVVVQSTLLPLEDRDDRRHVRERYVPVQHDMPSVAPVPTAEKNFVLTLVLGRVLPVAVPVEANCPFVLPN